MSSSKEKQHWLSEGPSGSHSRTTSCLGINVIGLALALHRALQHCYVMAGRLEKQYAGGDADNACSEDDKGCMMWSQHTATLLRPIMML